MWRIVFRYTFLCLIGGSISAQAIIVRHDKRDSHYHELAARYAQVFWLYEQGDNRRCLATLVDEQWALTAAHCLRETPLGASLLSGSHWSVQVRGQDNAIDRVAVHPDYDSAGAAAAIGTDLAMLHLLEPAGVAPAEIYEGQNELDTPLLIMGWGNTGTGLNDKRRNDHRFRIARNQVTRAAAWLEFVFDDPVGPLSEALNLEGMPGPGDSGGPAFIDTANGMQLAGVARGELQGELSRPQGLYGAVAIYERVSLHSQWLKQVISGEMDRKD